MMKPVAASFRSCSDDPTSGIAWPGQPSEASPQTDETCWTGTKHRPHPEEHRVAMRLEGWNESVAGSLLRDGRARARPPQDEVHSRIVGKLDTITPSGVR